jgi:hypothetical protein
MAQYTPEGVENTAKITGKVFKADGKSASGVRVLAAHLSSGAVYASESTRGNGEFLIGGLPYGYYDLAVEGADGLFVADRVINLRPAGEAAILFTLRAFDASTRRLSRPHPGSDRDPAGMAGVREKPKGREFWSSPKGVAILSGLGGAALLAIAAGSDFDPNATQF